MNNENFAGYVLAGGKSSRMGKDKAFLEIGGETFLARAVSALSEVCPPPIRAVVKERQNEMIDRFPADVQLIYDEMNFDSPLDGLHRVFSDCLDSQRRYAVILAVDLPFVSGAVIETLAEIIESSNKFLAVVPRQTDGRPQPLCAVYNAKYCFRVLNEFINENPNGSIRAFLETISPRYVDQKKLPDANAKDIFFNVNRPADFESIQ